jgi:hypothetical protein
LLYSVVVIRSKAQCRALGDALQKNPDLGRFIKKLRAEGGFGAHLQHMIKYAPTSPIYLSLSKSPHRTPPLALLLGCL